MNKEKIIISIIAIIMSIAILVLVYHLISSTKTIQISLISGLLGLFAILFTQHSISKRSIQEAHRSKKTEIYIGFLDMMAKVFQSSKEEREKNSLEMQKFMVKFRTDIILWGSPKVIKCCLAYQESSIKQNDKYTFLTVDNLYIAMREDIGLINNGLDKYDLVKMYLKDPNELKNI